MRRPVTKLEAYLRARQRLHAVINNYVREIEAANWRGEFEETIPITSRLLTFEASLRATEEKIWELLDVWLQSRPPLHDNERQANENVRSGD